MVERNPRHSSIRRSKGFTLIELLVVIALIALLAAILFPVFARARENARRASCMSNMKQLGLGMQMYSQDYDERMVPYNLTNEGNSSKDAFWPWRLLPYTKNGQIFTCPSQDRSTLQRRDWNESTYKAYSPLMLSYGYNYYWLTQAMCGDGVDCASQYVGPALSAIQSTAETALFVESTAIGWHAGYGTVESGGSTRYNHFEGANVCYVDGHVKWLKTVPLFPLDWHAGKKFADPVKAMFHMGRTQ
jgi:prepilin-type N-terminal cleavage/methylation domain-containing protein/prepilin-type processing-associated H-X9-DG protein